MNLLSSLADIPQDIMLGCVGEYLNKPDQYKLFSLCRAWKLLLYQSRSLYICCHPQGKHSDICRHWELFKTSEEHRQKLLHICGFHISALSSLRRPLQLNIGDEDVIASSSLILAYVQYFSTIAVVYEDEPLLSVTTLAAPTSESFTRFLNSGWQQEGSTFSLQEMWNVAQLTSSNLSTLSDGGSKQRIASCSTLLGVHRLYLKTSLSLFVEMSPKRSSTLYSVILNDCSNIVDVTPLQGVSEVNLVDCTRIRDVSPLAHVDSLVLTRLQLHDISMLGSVRKLVLRSCVVENKLYPVPTFGRGQQWTFSDMDISDATKLASLENLALFECSRITDASMLGHVRYLTIGTLVNHIQLPTPLGRFQEWSFTDLDMSNVVLEKFNGLYTLTLEQCLGVELSGIKKVAKLKVIDCEVCGVITHIAVQTLSLLSNYDAMVSFKGEVNIDELNIEVSNQQPIIVCFPTGTKLHSLHLSNAESGEIIAKLSEDELVGLELLLMDETQDCRLFTSNTLSSLKTELFTNSSLRIAAAFWCFDSTKSEQIFGAISTWNVSQVTNMRGLWNTRRIFNCDINSWDVSNVTDMTEMFSGALFFNQPLNDWNVSKVTDMTRMFNELLFFNQPLNNWNVSNVTKVTGMFCKANSFNQTLNNWNMSRVTNMTFMFYEASSFNQPLDNWNVSNVTSFHGMFSHANRFNQPLDTWDVNKATMMKCMFSNASSFNQPLNSWNVSKVVNMTEMFRGASSFRQLLDNWDVRNPNTTRDFIDGAQPGWDWKKLVEHIQHRIL